MKIFNIKVDMNEMQWKCNMYSYFEEHILFICVNIKNEFFYEL